MRKSNITIIFLILSVVNGNVNITNNDITYVIKDSRVWVIEKYSLPYETHIRHIFIPPPNSTVTSAFMTQNNVVLYTDNHYEWEYQRFKLRNVEYNQSPKLTWNAYILILLMFAKSKICSCLLKL